ncbi:MAG: amidophosphoribosyltransferase [Kiritimatiellae bacterium]|nr:amidophosphoribosyltransferase [Kiritimatiellia bacterium]
MTDELKHECAVAMVVLRKSAVATGDFGGTKLSLLLEKQHNRGQDGAGAAILSANPEPGETPYWIAKSASATPLADVLAAIGKRVSRKERIERKGAEHSDANNQERIFLGHLRYATFGKNDVAFCHPFVHESSELDHTILLAGNFNLTNAHELFDDYRHHGSFPTSKSDGYLITSLIAKQLEERSAKSENHISKAISAALANADGAWTLCGMTADGWAFATRDPHGIRPGWHYIDEDVVVVASERAAIQAAFDVPPEAVKELPPGEALVVSPEGKVEFCELDRQQADVESPRAVRHCSFERIYFSRANDADIHRERKALGAALVPRILEAANAPMDRIFFSYIPNSARIAFHGLLEDLFKRCVSTQSRVDNIPRFGEVAVKDAKFRTFIADAAARREFYKHVYDVTYGLVKKDDTLVVLDDSIVRGNTMKNAILPMLDRLGPKRIVIASSAPPIRYPDCYGIDMSTLGELVAFRALVNLLGDGANDLLHEALMSNAKNPLEALYAKFTEEQHTAEIARLLTPPDIRAEVVVVYQTVDDLRRCLGGENIGDWYFTGDYPTPGGYKVLRKALLNYLDKNSERSY